MIELLERWNPWWSGAGLPVRLSGIKREKYLGTLTAQIDEHRVSVVSGPRRAGKTTLLYQVIEHLISSGTDPKKILYAQLDHPGLDADIGTLLREFRKLNKIPAQEQVFMFLDEVQYAADWAQWAKTIHDMNEGKLFLSGSTTALIEKDAHASLTGRWRKNIIWPLDFGEFLKFRGVKINGGECYLETSYLSEYMKTGGFPEVVQEDNSRKRSQMLVELFDDIVFKDAARSRNLRDPVALRQVAVFMAGAIGTPVSVNKMRNTFKLSADAISSYIGALCSAYLFFPCPYYSKSVNERIYNPKKYYMIDTGMAAAVLGKINSGSAIENLLALHYHDKEDIWYWKSEKELDLVIGDANAALESKFRDGIKPQDIRGGLAFAKNRKLKKLYVATKEQHGMDTVDGIDIHYIPAARILLGKEGP